MGFFGPSGPNPYVTASAQSAQNFLNTLSQQQQVQFAGQQNALNAISNAWAPVLSTGVVPYGYSPGLDQLLQANVIQTGTEGIVNASNAALLQERQAAGGAGVLPTGAQAAINAQIQATGQQNIARGLQAEKIAGYQQGITNLEGATQAELGIAKTEAPTETAGQVNQADIAEREAGQAIFQEQQATSPFADLEKGLTAAGQAVNLATGVGDVGSMFQNAMVNAPNLAAQAQASNVAFNQGMGLTTTGPSPQTVTQ